MMMDMCSSFKSYGKVNEAEQARIEGRRRTRRRIGIITFSSILFIVIIVAAVVGTRAGSGSDSHNSNDDTPSMSASVKAVCDVTLHKDTCFSSLSQYAPNSTQPEHLFNLSMTVALNEVAKVRHRYFGQNSKVFSGVTKKMSMAAVENCRQLLSLAEDHIQSSISSGKTSKSVLEASTDLKTWLSSATTYIQTCLDGIEEANDVSLKAASVNNYLRNSTEFTSNSLAIINWLSSVEKTLQLRRLLMSADQEWIKAPKYRVLLESDVDDLKKKADVVVAQDGSGTYETINAALDAVPDKSNKRFIIYVKKGIYFENVRVEKSKWNVMMIGDGMTQTIVSASNNVIDGTPTFSSATFAVFGKGFIARDMGFENTAGAIKHQAVGLMSTADESVFYRCHLDAFQDTLYSHSNRQFYRECNIYGTVDFIFGNSAVVIQSCNILPKRPMPGQQNTITAQGKLDPNQNTGISIQNCTIWPSANLTDVDTFLGRPWKNYSTIVYMHSMMGSLINPKGWLPWVGDSAPDTIFYAEYQNFGPGSVTTDRVKWTGLRNITEEEASKFTVSEFLRGQKWISDAGVTFMSGL